MSAGIRSHILLFLNTDGDTFLGKTLFMYCMFWMFKEVFPEADVEFFPYQLGPYSNQVAKECNEMAKNGFLEIAPRGKSWTFTLTDKGRAELGQLLLTDFDVAMREVKISQIQRIRTAASLEGLEKTREFLRGQYPLYFANARV